MATRVSEVIRGWLGWCPQARVPAEPRLPAAAGSNYLIPAISPDPAVVPKELYRGYRYYHTQPNLAGGRKTTYLLAALTLAGLAAAVYAPIPDAIRPVVLLLALLALVNALFSSLTVTVSQTMLEFWFGPGIWHKNYHLMEIAGCAIVKNSWWNGWGIRWTPHGMLYNVAGSDAVEVLFNDGHKVRIGTDEPEALAGAINHAIR
jgi:hypothetical protein